MNVGEATGQTQSSCELTPVPFAELQHPESSSACVVDVTVHQDVSPQDKQLEALPLLQQDVVDSTVAVSVAVDATTAERPGENDVPRKPVVHKSVKFNDYVEYLGPPDDGGSDSSDEDSHLRRVIISSIIGNTLEWYDFLIYTFLGGVLTQLFFPRDNVYAQMLAFYGVFAAGFVTRPLGALVFGRVSDRYSRRTALLLSIAVMSVPTALVGCLPTYKQAGLAAPLLLVLLRLLQGFAVGGEFSATMVFLVEHAPPHSRGLTGSWAFASVMVGVLVGSLVATLFTLLLSQAALLSWGWRLPFLLSLLGSGVGFYIRRHLRDPVCEDDDWEGAEHQQVSHGSSSSGSGSNNSSSSLTGSNNSKSNDGGGGASTSTSSPRRGGGSSLPLRRVAGGICEVMLLDFLNAIGFYLVVIFLPLYMQNFGHLSHGVALSIHTSNMLLYLALIPLGGWLSDRYGRIRVILVPALLMAAAAYPLWSLFRPGRPAAAWVAQAGLVVLMAGFTGALPATFVALFPSEYRCTGLSLGHNLSMAAFGGTAPLMATALLRDTRDPASPAALLIVAAALTAAGALLLRRWRIR